MTRRLCRALVRISAMLAPRRARARWREEWLAEIDAASAHKTSRLGIALRASGAPLDAALLRWTTRSIEVPIRHGWTADIRDALRSLLKTPLQTATMIGCLAVGASLMVTVFAIANAITTGRLPGIQDRSELVRIGAVLRRGPLYSIPMAAYREIDWRSHGLESIGGERGMGFATVNIRGEAHTARASCVTGTYFNVLRTVPAAGRLLSAADDQPSAAPAIVMAHTFWLRHFGGAHDVVGTPLQIGTRTYEIAGVTPPGFVGLRVGDLGTTVSEGTELFVPLAHGCPASATVLVGPDGKEKVIPDTSAPELVARLAPGMTAAAVDAQLRDRWPGLTAGARDAQAKLGVRPFYLVPLQDNEFALFYGAIFTVPVIVLMIACANVATLQVSRAAERLHELAVRTSLGATRGRLARLLLLETLVIAIASGLAAWAASVAALQFSAGVLPFAPEPDWRVFAFSLLLPWVVTLAVGVIPSWRSTGFDVLAGLRVGTHGGGTGRSRMRRAVVVLQVALSIALVFGAVVISRAVATGPAGAIEHAHEIVTAGFYQRSLVGNNEAARRVTVGTIVQGLRELAPAEDIAFSAADLLNVGRAAMGPAGKTPARGDWFDARFATPQFFELLGVSLIKGRFFEADDRDVMVVTETFARRFATPESVVGTTFEFTSGGLLSDASVRGMTLRARVIGLVKDGFERDMNGGPASLVYLPLDMSRLTSVVVFMRTPHPAETQNRIRALAARVSPTLVPRPLATIDALVAEQFRTEVWLARAIGTTGMLALMLATAGLFGLVSASVTQRSHEFGVRVALGATRTDLVSLVIRDVARMALVGFALGVVLTVPAWWLIRDEFLDTATLLDPAGFAVVLAALAAAMTAAAYFPARRAGSVDPLSALRSS